MNKHIFTVYANSDDILTIETSLNRYFRKVWNTNTKHENSSRDSLILSVELWKVNNEEFEEILSHAISKSLKGTNLLHRENWYITTD